MLLALFTLTQCSSQYLGNDCSIPVAGKHSIVPSVKTQLHPTFLLALEIASRGQNFQQVLIAVCVPLEELNFFKFGFL